MKNGLGIALLVGVIAVNVWLLWTPSLTPVNRVSGEIRGVVLGADGKPLDGITVTLGEGDHESHAARERTVSADGGAFRFTPPAPSAWWIVSASRADAQGSLARVASGRTDIELRLEKPAFVVRGVVRSRAGKPLAGSAVRATPFPSRSRAAIFEALTDDGGHYELGLGDEAFTLTASSRGHVEAFARAARDETIDFALDDAATIRGRVLSGATREPVPFARVEADESDDVRRSRSTLPVVADSRGEFAFDSLLPGEYRFVATRGNLTGRSKTSSLALAGIVTTDASITLWPAEAISGRITVHSGGAPVVGAALSVSTEVIQHHGPTRSSSADTGDYTVAGVLAWPSVLEIDAPGFVSTKQAVTPGDPPLALTLYRGATFSGLVANSSGVPVESTEVTAWSGNYPNFRLASTHTDRTGHYKLDGFESGKVYLEVIDRTRGTATSKVYDVRYECGERNPTPTSDIVELRLHSGASIEGVVRDEHGTPAPFASVFGDRDVPEVFRDREVLTKSDAAGHFELRNLPPGTWSVGASTSGAQPILPDTKATVGGRDRAHLDLTLPAQNLSLTGLVRDKHGPLAGATVRAQARSFYDASAPFTTTDASGRFTIKDVDASDRWELSIFARGRSRRAASKCV